jgi:hypothetical protein
MARIEWVQLRLNNWALWKARNASGGMGYASQASFLAERVDNSRYRESVVPVDDVDAAVTDQGVMAMKAALPHLYETLSCIYLKDLGIKGTMSRLGRSQASVYAQLDAIDRWLQQWFHERREQQDAARVVYTPGALPMAAADQDMAD